MLNAANLAYIWMQTVLVVIFGAQQVIDPAHAHAHITRRGYAHLWNRSSVVWSSFVFRVSTTTTRTSP